MDHKDEILLNALLEIHKVWDSRSINTISNCKICDNREDFDLLLNDTRFRDFYPEEMLCDKFQHMLDPFFHKEKREYVEKTIYCKLVADDAEQELGRYSFSALTKEMISVDKHYFSESRIKSKDVPVQLLDLLYKPYLYELVFDSDLSELKKIIEEKSEGGKNKLIEGTWYKVTLELDQTTDKAEKEQGDSDKSNEDEEYNVSCSTKTNGVKGILWYSASEPQNENVLITKIEEAQDFIAKELSGLSLNAGDIVSEADDIIDTTLNALFQNITQSHIQVLRVGEANAIFISNTCNHNGVIRKNFAFDLGLPRRAHIIESDKTATGIIDDNDKLLMNPGQDFPEIMILSHWHSDHFNGIYVLPREKLIGTNRMQIIAPEYVVYKTDPIADRLVKFLIINDSIKFVGDNYSFPRTNNSAYRLIRVKKTVYKNDNDNCLMLRLNNTLLPGDCSYENWPDELFVDDKGNIAQSIDNFIITHHAAMKPDAVVRNTVSRVKSSAPQKAIVCTGFNTYGLPSHPGKMHPVKDVLEAYKDEKFEVLRTDDISKPSSKFSFDA